VTRVRVLDYDTAMARRVVVVLLALLVTPAFADPPKLKGTFGFDWSKPRVACAAVSGALLAKLTKDYTCVTPGDPKSSASGGTMVAVCTAKKGHSEYLVFATAKDCTEERETQLANGASE
jgi:hypothetical protein